MFSKDSLILKMGQIGSPETSGLHHITPHNNPEDGRIYFNRGGRRRVELYAVKNKYTDDFILNTSYIFYMFYFVFLHIVCNRIN
jgi:hypothetical protein